METALKICKRLHSYLYAGQYTGTIANVWSNRLEIDTPFGLIALVQRDCLKPFSCLIGGVKPFPAMNIRPGMPVLLGQSGFDIPDTELEVDITLAEDVDLSMDSMNNLFLPMDLHIRLRHILRAIEQGAGSEDLSGLVLSKKNPGALAPLQQSLFALGDALEEGEYDLMESRAAACAGFGSGAAAASDVLLTGYMAAYTALSYALGRSQELVRYITRRMAGGAASNTNDTGRALLLQGGEGLVDENRFQLLRALFSDTPYTTLSGCAMSMARGEGIQFLTGLCLAINRHYLSKTL